MSGVAVIVYKIKTNAAVLVQVPTTKIMAGILPLGTTVPLIGVQQVSDVERLTVSMTGTKKMHTERVQVTIEAATYALQKTIRGLVRTACRNANGTVNGVDLDSILPDGEGPDDYDPSEERYIQTLDFMVKYRV